MRSIVLRQIHWNEIQAHLEECLPFEGCGFFAGWDRHVTEVHQIRNVLRSTTRFQMDPREQVRILFDVEGRGLDLLGIYHSHPSGPPRPSGVDRSEAAYPGAVHLICGRDGDRWRCQAFTIGERGLASQVRIEWTE